MRVEEGSVMGQEHAAEAVSVVPQWWELAAALAPLGTLAAAVVAAVIGLRTIRQRSLADRRAEFWRRTEWAMESSASDDPRVQFMGTMVLVSLAKSDLIVNEEELLLLDAVWSEPIAEAEEAGLDEELIEEGGSQGASGGGSAPDPEPNGMDGGGHDWDTDEDSSS